MEWILTTKEVYYFYRISNISNKSLSATEYCMLLTRLVSAAAHLILSSSAPAPAGR